MFHTPPTKAPHTTTTTTADPLSAEITLINDDRDINTDNSIVPTELPKELQQLVSSFLTDLTAPRYNKPISADQLSAMFQDFYATFHYKAELFVKGSVLYKSNKVELLTKEEELKRKVTLRQFDNTVRAYVEIAEQQVTEQVFDRLFNKFDEDVALNDYINKKIVALQKVRGIDYDKFIDVEGVNLSDDAFTSLSHQLSTLSSCNSPASKLAVLLDVHSQINHLVQTQLNTKSVSGDYFLPLLIYIILIHQDSTDLYLHFLFISRFRNNDYLIAEPLYSLTNFEAALTYTRTLILTQESLDFSKLTDDEYLLLSQQSDLPVRKSSIVHNDTPIVSPTPLTSDGIRSLGNALDNSLKSLVKFGTDSAETGYAPLKGLAAGVLKWRSSTPSTVSTPVIEEKLEEPATINTGVNLEKFEKKQFEELTVAQLKEVWNDYRSLIDFVKSSNK